MVPSFFHRFLRRRHFWRHATFSEIAELYASRTMRIFALRLVSTFTSIYLIQKGYSFEFVAVFWALFYLGKVIFSYPSALQVARFGPKHATLISNIVAAISMIFLPYTTHSMYGLLALAAWGILQAYSNALNDIAYLVDFSKIKNIIHAGKEIGYMNIFEKVATGLSPLVGGVMALIFGPVVVMWISAALFLFAAGPLLLTAEPIRVGRHLDFEGFPWRTTWRSMVAQTAVGVDIYATGTAWTLFLILIVFTSGTDQVYAKIGFVTSISLFVALVASYAYGRLIDHNKGGLLLQYSSYLNSTLHSLRIFVATPFSVVLTNAVNEIATTGYTMPFMRGLFDTADISGKRIEYLYISEVCSSFGAAAASGLLALLFVITDGQIALQVFFGMTALLTLLIAAPKFALYRK